MLSIKKVLCLILSLVFLSTALCACGGGGQPAETKKPGDDTGTKSDDTTARSDETTFPRVEDSLPADLNFNGEKVTILTYKLDKTKNTLVDIYTDELNSDPINDSVFNRVKYVEDRLNVEISFPEPKGAFLEEMLKQETTGDEIYSIYSGVSHQMSDYIFDAFYYDLTYLDYLDFDAPWWNDSFTEESSFRDKVFMLTGSLSLTLLRGIQAVYFNKSIAENYSGKVPELNELYDIVNRGEWTIDKLFELSEIVYEDLNGNQIYDAEDAYGLCLSTNAAAMPFGAFNISVFEKDEDDWFVFNVNTDKLFDAYQKIFDLFYENRGSANANIDLGDNDLDKTMESIFVNCNGLFLIDGLQCVEKPEFRNMKDDYGILPEPKYNLQQKDYYAYSAEFSSFSISATNSRPETAAAVLEAMASYSYNETVPIYLDLALKGRYMSDPQSRKMIDLTIHDVIIDTAWIYVEEFTSWYAPGFKGLILNRENSFASEHAGNIAAIKRGLFGYDQKYKKMFGDD